MRKIVRVMCGGVLCCGLGVGFVLNTSKNQAVPLSALLPSPTPDQAVTASPVKASTAAPIVLDQADEAIFQHVSQTAMSALSTPALGDTSDPTHPSLKDKSMGDIVQAIAEQFVGTPYREDLLDRSEQETLIPTLREFDCVLFVETVLAMARNIALKDYSSQTFIHHLQEERYIGEETSGYCNRLHYFSHWIEENQRKKLVTNLTASLNGVLLNKPLNFMSSHWQSYPKLMNNEANRRCITQMEEALHWSDIHYIPSAQIHQNYGNFQPGDVVAIATNIPGLDVTHTGFIYRNAEGNIGIIHAAPKGVKISSDLATYVGRVDHAIGILIARPTDPRQAQ